MLSHLSVKNYAIIDEINLDFNQGFTVVTGETGAGKSILLGALRLVLGGRADLKSLKNTAAKCIIEAHFNIKDLGLKELFIESDFEYEDETILRREILPSGKTRAFINDVPATLSKIQELSVYLIDIHSQFQTATLLEADFQFDLVDAVANNADLLKDYRTNLNQYQKIGRQIKKLENEIETLQKEKDFNTFLLEELEEAAIDKVSIDTLEEELNTLENSEEIIEGLNAAQLLFNEEPYGIILQLSQINRYLKIAKANLLDSKDLFERIISSSIELEDIANELYRVQDNLSVDPERLLEVQERLTSLKLLLTKHRVQTIEELLEIRDNLRLALENEFNKGAELNQFKKDHKQLEGILDKLANSLSKERNKVIPSVEEDILQTLTELGMPHSKIKIELLAITEFNLFGKEDIQFVFSANAGMALQAIDKSVSGGERSRVMLAIKKLLAQHKALPTILFDEIDTGVSGKIASKMGEIMRDMGKFMQVVSITHLPQVAALGMHHFKVEKTEVSGTTNTTVSKLSKEERIQEIAQILSGNKISDAALIQAKQLMNYE